MYLCDVYCGTALHLLINLLMWGGTTWYIPFYGLYNAGRLVLNLGLEMIFVVWLKLKWNGLWSLSRFLNPMRDIGCVNNYYKVKVKLSECSFKFQVCINEIRITRLAILPKLKSNWNYFCILLGAQHYACVCAHPPTPPSLSPCLYVCVCVRAWFSHSYLNHQSLLLLLGMTLWSNVI